MECSTVQCTVCTYMYTCTYCNHPSLPCKCIPTMGCGSVVWIHFHRSKGYSLQDRSAVPCAPVPKRWKCPLWKFLWNFLTAFVQVGNMATMAR